MSHRKVTLAFALPLLAIAFSACTSTGAADTDLPVSGANSAAPIETPPGDWDVQTQPEGDLKFITYAPDAFVPGQANFEGTLTKDERGCIGQESAGGTALLAVSAQIPIEFIGEDQIQINEEVFNLGDNVSITGGNQQVGEDLIEACGNPTEVTLVSTIQGP